MKKTATRPEPKRICVEGNNGGSFVEITETDMEGVIRLRVGHDCVISIDREVSVFNLAATLDQVGRKSFEGPVSEMYAGEIPDWAGPL